MGAGIAAAISLTLTPERPKRAEYFTKGFFENFDVSEENGKELYTIKHDILLSNYKPFLIEFYDLIEESLDSDDIQDANSIEEFMDVYERDARNSGVPFVHTRWHTFSTLGCRCPTHWLFYRGSYKAYLEVYSTFTHFENILAKTMKNPLTSAIKFGIWG